MATFSHGARDDMMQIDGQEQMLYMGTHGCQTDVSFTLKLVIFTIELYDAHCLDVSDTKDIERIAISFNLQHAEDLGSYHHGDDFDYSILDYE